MTCLDVTSVTPTVPEPAPEGLPVEPGLTQVASSVEASSAPTYYSNSHRLARTAGGRLLTVFGSHASGLQLAWRDAGSAVWSRNTTGDVGYGQILWGTDTGDWPASIAVVPGHQGAAEVAVVVWSGQNFSAVSPLTIRVLTDLDSHSGPRVGPPVIVAAPPLGAARPDVGVEISADGRPRVLLTWAERVPSDAYGIVAAWLEDPHVPAPALTSPTVLHKDGSANRNATVAQTPMGMRVAVTTSGGRIRVFGHEVVAPLGDWWASGAGEKGAGRDYPSAAGLPTGEVLVASTRDPERGIIAVQRFTGPGQAPTTELTVHGCLQPSLAFDAGEAWLVVVRTADGHVISRSAADGQGWSAEDRVEIGALGGEGLAWPNAITDGGGRHLVVQGPSSMAHRSSVLALERTT